jgi:hypothetical protein
MAKWDGKYTVAVDFDGVLHMYKSGWKDLDIIEDEPHEDAWAVLEQYVENFHVHIFSARGLEPRGIDAMKKWFKQHNCPQHVFDKLIFATQKPPAHIFLDDRAWQFNGIFPTVAEIQAFKPWNKR